MGSIKNRNSEDLIEAEEIKKRWKEYMEELCKKMSMNCITKIEWSITQSQIFWSVKSREP